MVLKGMSSSFVNSVVTDVLHSITSVVFVIVCCVVSALVLVVGMLSSMSAAVLYSKGLVIGSTAVLLMYSIMS